MSLIYQYYVEGENERKLVEVLSKKLSYIRPGRIEVLNLVEKSITYSYTRRLKKNTVVILIFDTDTANIEILEKNIAFLLKCANIKDVVLIPQVCNLEDELLRSCKVKNVKEIFGSPSQKEFKKDFNRCTGLEKYLERAGFDFGKLWREKARGKFSGFDNALYKIEIQG